MMSSDELITVSRDWLKTHETKLMRLATSVGLEESEPETTLQAVRDSLRRELRKCIEQKGATEDETAVEVLERVFADAIPFYEDAYPLPERSET